MGTVNVESLFQQDEKLVSVNVEFMLIYASNAGLSNCLVMWQWNQSHHYYFFNSCALI